MTQETPEQQSNNKEKTLSMLQAGKWASTRSAVETPDVGGKK
jgi:hypothetical protein